jgi:hypothetical protein
VIHHICWTGGEQDYIVDKEHYEAGNIGIFDALTGQAIALFAATANRLYVVDMVLELN